MISPDSRSRPASIAGLRLAAPFVLGTLTLGLLLASCSRSPEADRSAGTQGPSPSATGRASVDPAAVQIVPVEVSALLDTVRAAGGRAVLLNVWASWCQPCREEFPDLLRLQERYRDRGLRLVLVSADFDDQLDDARRFLARHGVDFRTYLKRGDDMAFINTLSPQWSGALPACFVYDWTGHRYDFWEGRAPYEEMERRVVRVLDASQQPNL